MKKLVHRTTIITALGIAIMLTPAYCTATTLYSDTASFGTMTSGMTNVDFNSYLSGQGTYASNFTSSGITIGTVKFVGDNAGNTYTTYVFWGKDDQTDWYQGPSQPANAIVQTGNSTTDLHIVLPSGGATAVGFNLMSLYSFNYGPYVAGAYPISVSVNGTSVASIQTQSWTQTTADLSPLDAGLSATYLGILSSVPITYLDLTVPAGSIAIENFSFGTASTASDTPEVATMFLLGAGLLSMPLARRFAKRAA